MTHLLLRPLCLVAFFGMLGTVVPAAAAATPGSAQAAAWREQARALEHGEGVPRDPQQAIALYCQAALAGDMAARYNLGWIYANGRGVERNDAYAAYFFQLAAAQGDVPSHQMLQRLGTEAAAPPCAAPPQSQRVRVTLTGSGPVPLGMADFGPPTTPASAQEKRVVAIVQRLAPEYGIHPGLALAVIRAESNFNPQAISSRNAQGLMQLIPATAARFQVRKPLDPEQNIRGGLSYLRWLMAYFKGQVHLVLAAYNAGEGTVEKYRGVPPYPETQSYIRRIQAGFTQTQHPYDAAVTQPSSYWQRLVEKKRK